MAQTNTIFKIFNIIVIWVGITLIIRGLDIQNKSNYRPPTTPVGWVMGMVWIGLGAMIATTWVLFIAAAHIDQIIQQKPRWTRTRILASGLILLAAAVFGVIGTYSTWKHPFLLTPCDCLDTEWGKLCTPCNCGEHGTCNSGIYGDGSCACDVGWTGQFCDVCDERFKPAGKCDKCRLGYEDDLLTGERCTQCARQYRGGGDKCDICSDGWKPWTHNSTLFPKIVDDDGRHICDECMDNYWGYNCKPCAFGNDVPKITLEKNSPITDTSRVRDKNGKLGTVYTMNVKNNDGIFVPSWDYDPASFSVKDDVQIKIRYDMSNEISSFMSLRDINAMQCGNRGICRDDKWQLDNNKDWNKKCTYKGRPLTCTVHNDCKVSENCKGRCRGIEAPVPQPWDTWASKEDNFCESDDDCQGPEIDDGQYYAGGRCLEMKCCQESRHGDGACTCNVPNAKEPACDFCPGYDWMTGVDSTICMGNGDCQPSFDMDDNYIKMRCFCKSGPYITPSGIVDTTITVKWVGEFCECGNLNNDNICDSCASGFWGQECKQCPGGAGLHRECGGHGTCNAGIYGDGTCKCTVDFEAEGPGAWMLAPYEPRYDGDEAYQDKNGNSGVCTECLPNFFGDKCKPCFNTVEIAYSELNDIFQPGFSYHLGGTQTNEAPKSICHRVGDEDICLLSCGGGGWCDWGRKGSGKCKCWSNKKLSSVSWNPLDNVCIGSGDNYQFCEPLDFTCKANDPSLEVCPALGDKPMGWCVINQRSRKNYLPCQADDNCPEYGGEKKCMPFQKVRWAPNDQFETTCIEDPY